MARMFTLWVLQTSRLCWLRGPRSSSKNSNLTESWFRPLLSGGTTRACLGMWTHKLRWTLMQELWISTRTCKLSTITTAIANGWVCVAWPSTMIPSSPTSGSQESSNQYALALRSSSLVKRLRMLAPRLNSWAQSSIKLLGRDSIMSHV